MNENNCVPLLWLTALTYYLKLSNQLKEKKTNPNYVRWQLLQLIAITYQKNVT